MPRSWPGNERILTPDEKLLWRLITRDDQIYDMSADDDVSATLLDVDGYAADQAAKPAVQTDAGWPPARAAKTTVDQHAIICGQYAGVDKATARRMQRGQLPIDMILDLHGSSQLDARDRLRRCLERCAQRGYRLLLVITGKGNRGSGVLRQLLPQWLNEAPMRDYVLACDVAGRQHGAQGAYYVLLRRKTGA